MILQGAKSIDLQLSNLYINILGEKNGLIILLFHSVFKDQSEIDQNVILPQQKLTVDALSKLIESYKKADYSFISPIDLNEGLDPTKKHLLLTFDDGYYNNKLAVDILNQHKVPALFFISTEHVKSQKSFWWDSIYRFETKQGTDIKKTMSIINSLKDKQHTDIHQHVLKQYGEKALNPIGDVDRPFTIEELKQFSQSPYVFIGNHTRNHAILTNYEKTEMLNEISCCQSDLVDFIGFQPKIISYPNGNYNRHVIDASLKSAMDYGITGDTGKNYMVNSQNKMKLKRMVVYGDKNIEKQVKLTRSDFSLYQQIRKLKTIIP